VCHSCTNLMTTSGLLVITIWKIPYESGRRLTERRLQAKPTIRGSWLVRPGSRN
jgi:hypothetical protein